MKKFSILIAAFSLALLLLTSCRPPELEGAFVDFNAGRLDNALKLAEKAVSLYPQNAEAWYLLGEIYGKKDRFADMVNAFDKSLAQGNTFATKIETTKLIYFQNAFNNGVNNYNAFTKFEDRKSEKAIKTINRAITAFKNANTIKQDYKSLSLVASSYNISDRSDSAFVFYQEMAKAKPDTADAWIALGNYYFMNKNWDKTIENMKKALEFDENNVEAITLISQSYDMKGDAENALKAYEKAKELNPEEKAFPYNIGLIYNKWLNKEGVSDSDKAFYLEKLVENFGRVIELDPEIEVPYQIKAYAEIQQKKYEDAIETLNSGLELFPEAGELWFNLGVAYTHLNKADEAKDAFKHAEELGYK